METNQLEVLVQLVLPSEIYTTFRLWVLIKYLQKYIFNWMN